jgi:2-methylisocitrate lyase-like PEP mutase family enzyme
MLFVSAGATAIATTSAGLAWSCGFPDGDALPRQALLSAVAAILRACPNVPVSVDVEAGYSGDPGEVAILASQLAAMGVAGINLEDGDGAPELLAAKIEAVKRKTGIFVNARADVYLRELAQGDEAVAETVARAKDYARAGADGIFVPGIAPEAIATVARATPLPFALLAEPGLPSFAELYELGVRRISAGSGLAKIAYGRARAAASAFLEGESGALFCGDVVPYAEMNALAARHQSRPGGV